MLEGGYAKALKTRGGFLNKRKRKRSFMALNKLRKDSGEGLPENLQKAIKRMHRPLPNCWKRSRAEPYAGTTCARDHVTMYEITGPLGSAKNVHEIV